MAFDLRNFRKANKLTQKRIAEALRLPQSSISFMETGKQKVSDRDIEILKATFGETNVERFIMPDNYAVAHIQQANSTFNGFNKNQTDPQIIDLLTKLQSHMASSEERIKEMQSKLFELMDENRGLYQEIATLTKELSKYKKE